MGHNWLTSWFTAIENILLILPGGELCVLRVLVYRPLVTTICSRKNVLFCDIPAFPTCGPNQFMCRNFRCIDLLEVCDGTDNCKDGNATDEVGCRKCLFNPTLLYCRLCFLCTCTSQQLGVFSPWQLTDMYLTLSNIRVFTLRDWILSQNIFW